MVDHEQNTSHMEPLEGFWLRQTDEVENLDQIRMNALLDKHSPHYLVQRGSPGRNRSVEIR